MTVVDPIFVDTNVLAYVSVTAFPFHRLAQAAVYDLELANVPIWVSRQILR